MPLTIPALVGAAPQSVWLPASVPYFFLIALSVTALLMALPGFLFGRAGGLARARLALMVAVTTGVTAPVARIATLHQPDPFPEVFAAPARTFWMAWGGWGIAGYVLLVTAFAWALHRPAFAALGREEWRLAWLFRLFSLGGAANGFARPLGLAAGGAALAILAGSGIALMEVRARPLWNTPLLPAQFAATGFLGAIGLMLVLGRVLGLGRAEEVAMNRALARALGVVAVLGLAWFALALSGLSPRHAAALASVAGVAVWQRIAVWGAVAVALPFGLALAAPRAAGWITGLVAIHAAWMVRWSVFIGGQAAPELRAGLHQALMPTGLPGLMGVIGTFGLWLFLALAYTTFIPWAEGRPPRRGRAQAARRKPELIR